MSQQAGDVHKSALSSALSAKQYAAGGPYDLVADSPDAKRAARAVYFLNAGGNLTHGLLADGVTDRPLTGAPAGYQHIGHFTSITPTVAVVAYGAERPNRLAAHRGDPPFLPAVQSRAQW